MAIALTALLTALLVVGSPAHAADDPTGPSPTGPTRIMLAGDSITQGRSGDYTYRYWLWRGLQNVGADVDFVGSRHDLAYGKLSYLDPAFDQDHSALAGATTAYHLPRVADEVRTLHPDVIVLLLGFNDLRVRTPEATAANLRAYVEQARAVDPDVSFVLGHVTTQALTTGASALREETGRLNGLIDAMARELDSPASRVVVARTTDRWNPPVHTWDGIHPTPTGQTVLAQAVADALARIGTIPSAPRIATGKAVPWPATFAVSGFGTNASVRLRWDNTLIDAWSGRVRLRLLGVAGSPTVTTKWASGSARTVDGLVPGGTYEIQVQPRRVTMEGAWSRPIRVRASGHVPVAPRGTAARWSKKAVRVTWREAHASDTYVVTYRSRVPGRTWSAWHTVRRSGAAASLPVPRRAAKAQVRVSPRNGYLKGPSVTVRTVRPH